MIRKTLIFLLLCSLLTLSGCRDKASQKRTLKLAHCLDTTHPVHKTMVHIAERVREKSDGNLTIEIFPGGQLGSEKECIEALQLGYLAMTKTSTSPMEAFIPRMKVFAVPYLFDNGEHFWKAALGPIGTELLDAGQDKFLKGLCYFDAGARRKKKKKPINSPKDLEGMKIRVQKSAMSMNMIKAMGGSPTPISWGELYTSLDQGVVDGAENNPPSFHTSRHYEICIYYSLDEHTRVPDMLVVSTKIWNTLTPQQQNIITEVIEESNEYGRRLWAEAENEAMRVVQEAGVKVIRPDKGPFQESVRSIWQEFEGTEVGKLIDKIREVR